MLHSGSLRLRGGEEAHGFIRRIRRLPRHQEWIRTLTSGAIHGGSIWYSIFRRRLVREFNAANVLQSLHKLSAALPFAQLLVSLDGFVDDIRGRHDGFGQALDAENAAWTMIYPHFGLLRPRLNRRTGVTHNFSNRRSAGADDESRREQRHAQSQTTVRHDLYGCHLLFFFLDSLTSASRTRRPT